MAVDTNVLSSSERHMLHMSQGINQMRKDCTFTDLTIYSANNDIFPCHKIVLASASNYFRTLLSSKFKESTSNVLTFPSVPSSAIDAILEFIYTGSLQILNSSNVSDVLHAADMFLLTDLFNGCLEFLAQSLDADNCIDIFKLASFYKCATLKNKAWQEAVFSAKEVVRSDAFPRLTEDELMLYVSDVVPEEQDVETWAHALYAWWRLDISRTDTVRKLLNELSLVERFRDVLKTSTEGKNMALLLELQDDRLGNNNNIDCIKDEVPCTEGACTNIGRYTDELVVLGGNPCLTSYHQLQNGTRSSDASILCFSPAYKTWHSKLRDIPLRGMSFSTTVVNNTLMVMSWNDGTAWKYCKATRQWVQICGVGDERRSYSLIACKGYVYRIGGRASIGAQVDRDVMRYDPIYDRWQKVAPMLQSLQSCSGAADKGNLHVTGFNPRGLLVMLCYTPQSDAWEVTTTLEVQRAHHGCHTLAAVVLNDMHYVITGLGNVQCFDPVKSCWKPVSKLNKARRGCSAAVSKGKIYVLGGNGNNGLGVTAVEEYDPYDDEWKIVAEMPYAVTSHTCLKLVVDSFGES